MVMCPVFYGQRASDVCGGSIDSQNCSAAYLIVLLFTRSFFIQLVIF